VPPTLVDRSIDPERRVISVLGEIVNEGGTPVHT
jgi:hypothetical protein